MAFMFLKEFKDLLHDVNDHLVEYEKEDKKFREQLSKTITRLRETYDGASDEKKKLIIEDYKAIIKQTEGFKKAVKEATEGIPGVGGEQTLIKFSMKGQLCKISLEKLGLEKISTDKENTLPFHIKNNNIEITSMVAKWVSSGNIELVVTLKNTRKDGKRVRFNIDSGHVFEPAVDEDKKAAKPAGYQAIGCNKDVQVELEKGEEKEFSISCVCLDLDCSGPHGVKYVLTFLKQRWDILGIPKDVVDDIKKECRTALDEEKRLKEWQSELWTKSQEFYTNLQKDGEKFLQQT